MNTPLDTNSTTHRRTNGATVFGYTLRVAGFCFLVLAMPLIIVLPLGLIGFLFMYIGLRLVREGRMISQVKGETLLRDDARPPVLYLRDFRNDAAPSDAFETSDWLFTSAWLFTTDEERLAAVMHQVGPFISLGAPEHKRVTDF